MIRTFRVYEQRMSVSPYYKGYGPLKRSSPTINRNL